MDENNRGLAAEDVSYAYPKSEMLLKNISFRLEPGKITAMLGANGCGKTTFFRVLMGGCRPNSGAVKLDGRDIRRIKSRDFAKMVAVVHQYNTAPDDFTVRKLVSMGRTPHKGLMAYGESEADKLAIERALVSTGTKEFEYRQISQLSGGQRQRVWLAMALAQEPKILLLDEITTYLDIRYQYEILGLIKTLNIREKLTILMVIHDVNQVLEFSDRIAAFKDGRLIVHGETEKVVTDKLVEDIFQISAKLVDIENKKYICFCKKD